ncbi:hypothetical protein N5094_06705 [Shewanella putrefaciens]|uniref:hypothetical protein n=1 Tax=Shewanella putrefaciens TaxID=24 RepID=UPI0021BE5A94|nr:hypothetical protein [Shewanella putrefaciens]UXK09899.1 hypothetical protein N5094_06705 [Shewanella putrefaciens]
MNILAFVSKPLQYINCRNSVESFFSSNEYVENNVNGIKVLVILDHFKGAKSFYERVLEFDLYWDVVLYCNSRVSALIQLRKTKFNVIFSNSDISKDAILIKFFNFKSTFLLYEEGWGNYIVDALHDQGFKKKAVYKILSLNVQYGLSSLTKAVYVYFPEKVPANLVTKAINFKFSFCEYLRLRQELFKNIFPSKSQIELVNYGGKKVAFLLPSKKWSSNFEGIELSTYDVIFLKPHPHTLDFNHDLVERNNIKVLDSSVFLELELSLVNSCLMKSFDVYHDNSMIGIYLIDTGVNIVNLGRCVDNKVLNNFFSLFDI